MNKWSVKFLPKDKNGLPWVIQVDAHCSASAIARAASDMVYMHAQDPSEFQPPTVKGVQE